MVAQDADPPGPALESREPSLADLVELCRQLNARGARYVVIGGFAMRAAGLDRRTIDIDLLIETGVENEARVFAALESLPDQCVRELTPGEVAQHAVVRVADEIVVDLMKAACGIDYAEAAQNIVTHVVGGVPIPFASPRLLWRTKRSTYRAKDAADLRFLALLFEQAGETPPED
jgi:hypothetical protein